jgi:hypothetical protein
MAQKVTVELEDDLDGGPADETVRFGVDGSDYEIDLSAKNAAALRRKLAPFIEHARKAGRGARRRPGVPHQAGSAAAISGRGRKTGASRSANAGASPRASLSSTKPLPNDPDARAGSRRARPDSPSSWPRALTPANGTRLSSAPAVGKKRTPGSAE